MATGDGGREQGFAGLIEKALHEDRASKKQLRRPKRQSDDQARRQERFPGDKSS